MSKSKSYEFLEKRLFDTAGAIMEQYKVPLVITLGVKQPAKVDGKRHRLSRKREKVFGSTHMKEFQEDIIRKNNPSSLIYDQMLNKIKGNNKNCLKT